MNNFLVKAQGLGLFPVTSWPSFLEGRKLESEVICNTNFRYSLQQEKDATENRRSYDMKNRMDDVTILTEPVLPFATILGNPLGDVTF